MSDLTKEEIADVVRATVKATLQETLFDIGLNATDAEKMEEVRKDMMHLRKWRKSVDQVYNTTFLAALGIIITGIMGALWLGFKALLGQ